MFERNYSFYHHCCCLAVTWCSKMSNLSEPKWGAQATVRGSTAPLPQQRHWVTWLRPCFFSCVVLFFIYFNLFFSLCGPGYLRLCSHDHSKNFYLASTVQTFKFLRATFGNNPHRDIPNFKKKAEKDDYFGEKTSLVLLKKNDQ